MEIGESSYPRRQTRQVMVGDVAVGGGAPVTVQSMTITKTADVEGTLQQIYALAAAGADIVRCTCNEIEAAEGLAQIVPRSPIPIIADIHHQYRRALEAMEAGVQGLRLNPGNIRRPEHIKAVAAEARDRGVPIRIGVNAGSLDPSLYERYGGATPEAMVESAQQAEREGQRKLNRDEDRRNGNAEQREGAVHLAAGRPVRIEVHVQIRDEHRRQQRHRHQQQERQRQRALRNHPAHREDPALEVRRQRVVVPRHGRVAGQQQPPAHRPEPGRLRPLL